MSYPVIQFKEAAPDLKILTGFVDCKVTVLNDDDKTPNGVLEGYASIFDNEDLGGDIVERGAFSKTLKENLTKGRIKLVDSHNVYEGTRAIIGVVREAKEDELGLWFKANFSSAPLAQEIRTKIREGILDALSFGYRVVKDKFDEVRKVRLLQELRLYEISVVPWGMNPKAHITTVKDLPTDLETEEQRAVREEAERVARESEAKLDEAIANFQSKLGVAVLFDKLEQARLAAKR